MAYYRLYFLDRETDHIAGFVEIEAEEDAAALPAAHLAAGDAPFELWCGTRKVHSSSPAVGRGRAAA